MIKKEILSYSKKITVKAKSSFLISFSRQPVTHFLYVLPEMVYIYTSSVFPIEKQMVL